jgi:hypothetical protein
MKGTWSSVVDYTRNSVTTDMHGSTFDVVRSAHDVIAMLLPSVHAEVIEREVIVNAAHRRLALEQ